MRLPLERGAALLVLPTAFALDQPANFGRREEQRVLSAGNGVSGGGKGRNYPLGDKFKEFAEASLERWRVPGVAVGVVDGVDIWTEGYGIGTFPSKPVTPSTLFYTGSTTKAFTAATVSLLIASGNFTPEGSPLSWQTPISHLIRDDFVLPPGNEWAQTHLTLEDALSHRTGFPRHDKALGQYYGPDHHRGTVRDVVRSFRYLPPVTEPRTRWRYCNLMYMVVSHVVQTLTGQWLGDTMRERIWEPLGMVGTYFSVEEALDNGEDVAAGYYWDYSNFENGSVEGKGKGFVEVPKESLYLASGAGGIVSNVQDYTRWIQCLIRGDRTSRNESVENGCEVLPKEAHLELKLPRIVMAHENQLMYDSSLAYALGWEVGTYKGHRIFTHSGGMEAYGAEVYFLPDLEYGVVTLGNTAQTSNFVGWDISWKLIDNKLDIPEEERFEYTEQVNEILKSQLKLPETAVDDLYPDRADPPLPRALPLEDYVGVYYHPAYQNVTLELIGKDEVSGSWPRIGGKKSELKAIRDNMEWQMTFEFGHVSGEYWVVIVDSLYVANGLARQLARAEFEVGAKGKVEKLKMEFFENGSEGAIVFDKIA
ncbi:beta-lactamase/transpeptidase-like protein [Hypoxylon trugodes]|uniref:beta-lactamase/transpeptidase-like protein n=1 Tax=Hypoxylon trugodes TaxID=326681 RepID=UPI0021931D79|nr:beta-lactamase/transpeptidase-like protein [Hypoxylon trugodes]KAI1387779.1 beta-lactamase/transpeptidase-like protein [Hypoxylon trugodes]